MPANHVAAIVLAGGQGERLSVLSARRAKPAVPFAGKFRIIDFTLSNCVNSGIYNVAVLTQYRPHSLNDHIGIGRPWDLDRNQGGIRMLQPYLDRGMSDWYRGTADAVFQNLPFIADWRSNLILVLSGDHIYKMDYTRMLAFHEQSGADATVAVLQVPMAEAHRFGTMTIDASNKVVRFEEKATKPNSNLASMGVYVFNASALSRYLTEDAERPGSTHDFGKDIIPQMVDDGRVYAFSFRGYWRDVGTIPTYFEANMGLLREPPDFDLYDKEWVIHTRSEERPPAKLTEDARVTRSLISHGCTVCGVVERSVLSPGVFVAEGAVIRDSIIMTDAVIGSGCTLDHVIVDKEAIIGNGSHIGWGSDTTPNQDEPINLSTGITVLGKRAQIPPGITLGHNVRVDADVSEADVALILDDARHIRSGSTISHAGGSNSPFSDRALAGLR